MAFKPLARRINLTILLNRFLGPFSCILTCYAVAIIVLKMIAPSVTVWANYSLLLLPLAVLYAVWQCRRGDLFFQPAHVAEVVDHLYRNDGSVCTAFESPGFSRSDGEYLRILDHIEIRSPRLSGVYYLRKITPVILFTALAVALPPRVPAEVRQGKAILESLIQPLMQTLEEQKQLLPEEERAEIIETLEEIKADEEGISREQWEAIEEMRGRVERSLEMSRTSLNGLSNQMNQLATAAQQAQGDAESSADAERIMQELAKALQNQNLRISSELQSQLMKQMQRMRAGSLDAAKLRELAERLRSMGQGTRPGRPGDNPGRGGRDRGRGDAAMQFGEARTLENARYSDERLEQQYLSGNDLVSLGVTPVEPNVDAGRFSPGTLKQYQKQHGFEVSRSRISPSQKEVVRKFFDDTPKP